MRYLTTSFSPSMLDPAVKAWDVQMDQITPEEARTFLLETRPDFRVANEMLARLISEALSLPFTIPTSRSRIEFSPDDEIVIAAYGGQKLNTAAPLPGVDTLTFWKALTAEAD